MLASMTGFAREVATTHFGKLSIEIRTINHRYLEMYFKAPEMIRTFEPELRELLQKNLGRGKVEIQIRLESDENSAQSLTLNEDLARNVIALHAKTNQLLNTNQPLSPSELLRFPNVILTETPDAEALQSQVISTFKNALASLKENREAEGARIESVLLNRLEQIETLTKEAQILRPDAVQKLRTKLLQKIEELSISVDPQRLEQEIVFAAQKLDIDEELDRLFSHIAEMREAFKRKEPIGRRLDFLTQEFNREANTLGSKAQDASLTKISVELKVLIEQIREQIQNIE